LSRTTQVFEKDKKQLQDQVCGEIFPNILLLGATV